MVRWFGGGKGNHYPLTSSQEDLKTKKWCGPWVDPKTLPLENYYEKFIKGGALLASQAAAEGRIAGMNMYSLQLLRQNGGSVAVYAGMVGDLAFGAAGMTATQARQTGFPILVGEARGLDHYPPVMPGSHEVYCRLVFTRESLRLLGGQILGGATTGELANEIGFLIQNRVTAAEIAGFQTCMHPRLTASAHPITEATGDVLQQHLHIRATCH